MGDWLRTREASYLAADPGLGKSVVVLDYLDDLFTSGQSRGALILSKLRVVTCTWPTQIEKWDHSRWMKIADLRTPEGRKAWDEGTAEIYLLNFEQIPTIAGAKKKGFVEACIKGRKDLPVDTLIIDEISCFRDPSSKRFKALAPYVKQFKQRVALSGTPGDYMGLWSQIKLLDAGERLGVTHGAYKARHFDSDYMGFKFTLKPSSKDFIDQKLADLMLVTTGADHLDIPPTVIEDIEVTLPPEAKKAYKTLEKELLLELKNSEVVALNAAVLMNKLIQLVGGAVYDTEKGIQVIHTAKIDALVKLVKKLKGEPMLVLVSYKHESARILDAIPEARMFDEKDMALWQAGKVPLWISDFRSLSHGLDGLQTAQNLCWFTQTWSGEAYQQSNARLIRTGQKNPTTVYRIIAPGTADDAVVEALREKGDVQSGLLLALKNIQRLAESP